MEPARYFGAIGKQGWALFGLAAATILSVVLSLSAWAGNDGDLSPPDGPPPAMGGPGILGPGMMFSGRGLERMLAEVDATAAQRDQIHQLAAAAEMEFKALFEQGQALRGEGIQLWTAARLDPAAAETLRQKMSAHHEQISRRVLQLTLDVGNVLTVEQRVKLAERIKDRRFLRGERPHPAASRDN